MKKWRSPLRSFRGRLLLAALCVETLMLTLLVGNAVRVLDASLTYQAQVYAEQLTPVLHAALVTPLAQRDYATVQAILDESHMANVLAYMAVSDGNDKVMAVRGWPRDLPLPKPDRRFPDGTAEETALYNVHSPIRIGSQLLGNLQYGLSLKQLAQARRTQFTQSATIAAVEILLSAGLLTAIGIWLTRHLGHLTRVSEDVARGNYTPDMAFEGDDDIGRLGAAFNAMSRAVRTHVEELTDAIHKRQDVEKELRDSEARFSDLAESASDWFWETDARYRLTFASERIANVLGVKAVAIFGLTWFEIGLGESPAAAESHRREIAARAPFRDLVFTIGPPGGKDFRTIRISGIPIFSAAGAFVGYRGVGTDVSREAEAQREAARTRQQLVDAIESLADAIAVYDHNDMLVIYNAAYARMHHFDADFLSRRTVSFEQILRDAHRHGIFSIDAPDFEAWVKDRVARHRAADGQSFIVRTVDGYWFHNREYPTEEGGVVAVRIDITRLKQREEELDRLRRRYELILSSAGEGIVGVDERCHITFANRVAATLLCLDAGQLVGADFGELILDDGTDGQGDAMPLMAACRQGVSGRGRGQKFRLGDGGLLPVDYFVAPIVENGVVGGAVLVFQDATLRLQYEESLANQHRELERQVAERTTELRASREWLRGITDSLIEGVIVVDCHGKVVFANPSAVCIVECGTGSGIVGHPIDALLRVRTEQADQAAHAAPWRRAMTGSGIVRDDDAVFVLSSGRTIAVAYACSALLDRDKYRDVIISFREITTLKQAQHEAMQSARLASIGQLAAGIAHEINTPTQYIGDNLRYIGSGVGKLAEVVKAGLALAEIAGSLPGLTDAVARFEAAIPAKLPRLLAELPAAAQESLDGVAQIARIVLSMKEFSHPGTSGKTATDINRALENTLTVTRNTWKHFAEIERAFDPGLPPVSCHTGEMNQVFLNLIVNAAQALETSGKPLPGRISIATRVDGNWVEIRVSDSGNGVPKAIREHIFDPFFTTKAVGKGTGQGLAICRDVVVSKHGGSIEVGGEEGAGAVFTVRLPVDGATMPQDSAE